MDLHAHMIAPLANLVREVREIKVTCNTGTKKKKWYCPHVHQEVFDKVKRIVVEEVILAYPSYGELFEIYSDASKRQVSAVITQNEKSLAFFLRKLNRAQQKYYITELGIFQ